MTIRSRNVLAVAATLATAAGALGASAATAAAATKAKPKPAHTKAVADHAAAGVVVAVIAKSHEVKVKAGRADDLFRTNAATRVTDAGKKVALGALKAGEHVRVTFTGGGKAPLVAKAIVVTKA